MAKLVWYGNSVLRKIERRTQSLPGRIANVIAKIARRIVAVKTGALQRSIRATDAGEVIAGGGEVDYAAKVELGTAHQAAQPYMRPAIEQFSQSDLNRCIS